MFSSVCSQHPHITINRSLQLLIVYNCIYLILSCSRDLKGVFELGAKITISFILIASIYGIVIYHFGSAYTVNGILVTGIKGLGLELAQRMYGERISSFTGNPNTLGFLLVISMISSLYFINTYRNKKYTLIFLILLYTLLLTGSRASLLSLIIGIAFFTNYSYHRLNYGALSARVLLLILSTLICIYFLANPEHFKSMFSFMGRKVNDLNSREIAWLLIFSHIEEKPFLGGRL